MPPKHSALPSTVTEQFVITESVAVPTIPAADDTSNTATRVQLSIQVFFASFTTPAIVTSPKPLTCVLIFIFLITAPSVLPNKAPYQVIGTPFPSNVPL